jgi:Leucine-rich repeat (LRR) protein
MLALDSQSRTRRPYGRIGEMTRLETLDLAHNRIRSLPAEIGKFLEQVDVVW